MDGHTVRMIVYAIIAITVFLIFLIIIFICYIIPRRNVVVIKSKTVKSRKTSSRGARSSDRRRQEYLGDGKAEHEEFRGRIGRAINETMLIRPQGNVDGGTDKDTSLTLGEQAFIVR